MNAVATKQRKLSATLHGLEIALFIAAVFMPDMIDRLGSMVLGLALGTWSTRIDAQRLTDRVDRLDGGEP